MAKPVDMSVKMTGEKAAALSRILREMEVDTQGVFRRDDEMIVPARLAETVKAIMSKPGWADTPIESLRAAARAALVAEADRIAGRLMAGYSEAEREAWPAKLEEARAVVAGGDPAAAVLLGIEAALRTETVAALAQRIVAKAPLTLAIPAAVAGLRAATEAAIDAALDQAAIDDALASAKAKAEALAAAVKAGDMATFMASLTA